MKSKIKYYIVEDGDGTYLMSDTKNPTVDGEILVAEYENLKDAEKRLCLEIQRGE